jgi:hypothetical protein
MTTWSEQFHTNEPTPTALSEGPYLTRDFYKQMNRLSRRLPNRFRMDHAVTPDLGIDRLFIPRFDASQWRSCDTESHDERHDAKDGKQEWGTPPITAVVPTYLEIR